MSACETDVNRKVAAFSMYLNANTETGQNLTNENVELLSKFAEFLKAEKGDKHKYNHEFKHGFGKFGKHGHHGMSGLHFGKHGPFGRYGHGHGHGHRHGHHGKHGGGRHELGKHGFDFGKHGPEFFGTQGQGLEFSGKHGKHHRGKHMWKWAMLHEQCKNNESGHCVIAAAMAQENPAPTAAEGPSQGNNVSRPCNFRMHHWGRHGQWLVCPFKRDVTPITTQPEPAANVASQENLATLVEHISIANTPPPQKE